jgi:hypothetical protein
MKMESTESFMAEQPMVDLSKPSLSGLSYMLRQGGFEWDYRDANKCAMAVAHRQWREVDYPSARAMSGAFGISEDEAFKIFCRGGIAKIAAEMVADEIDELAAVRISKEDGVVSAFCVPGPNV